jgi:hypothetical protein
MIFTINTLFSITTGTKKTLKMKINNKTAGISFIKNPYITYTLINFEIIFNVSNIREKLNRIGER